MAYFGFTDSILAGKGITEFRNADGTELQRDFTYITDIVTGVIAAARRAAPLDVFNLGNTHPEKVSSLIGHIEEGLGVRANVTVAPITAGDVPLTYADVSHARKVLGYQPKVSLASGIRRFLQWYSAYYRVPLPASMAPTRRESFELRQKYDIPAPLTSASDSAPKRAAKLNKRRMTAALQRSA